MKNAKSIIVGGAITAIAITIFAFTTQKDDPNLDGWSQEHKDAVQKMTEKYGKPNESTANMVVWHNNGPWKKTVIYKEDIEHNFPKKHHDFIQQYVNFKTPIEK